MKIIGGKFKGYTLKGMEDKSIRPTLGKAREAIFNRLIHHPTWGPFHTLYDAFAGSGIFGLEALSHDIVKEVVFMDTNTKALNKIKVHAKDLEIENQTHFFCRDSSSGFSLSLTQWGAKFSRIPQRR